MANRKHQESPIAETYQPAFEPEDPVLPGAVIPENTPNQVKESVEKKVARQPEEAEAGDIPRPLSYDEAREAFLQKQALRRKITAARERIADINSRIEELVQPDDGSELGFNVDISRRGAVKTALRKAFGIKTNVLTYEMYKVALKTKHRLEKEGSDDYVNGDSEN